MNKKTFAILGLIIGMSSVALAGDPAKCPVCTTPPPLSDAGFFIGTDGSVFPLQDRSLNLGGLPLSADLHYKTGWGVNVPVGYNFGNGLSIGISGGYYEADLSSVSVNTLRRSFDFGVSGKTELVPVFAEASYSVNIVGNLSWNIGAGIGSAYTHDSAYGVTNANWDFAFEGTTGLSYRVSPLATLNLGYRYMNVNEQQTSHVNGHSIELGFRLKF